MNKVSRFHPLGIMIVTTEFRDNQSKKLSEAKWWNIWQAEISKHRLPANGNL